MRKKKRHLFIIFLFFVALFLVSFFLTLKNERKEAQPELENSSCTTVSCWQKVLFSTLEKEGIDKTFNKLAQIYEQNPDFATSCHYITHNLGLEAYQYFKKDKDSVLTPQAAYCANGFYHGFMEALLGATKDPEQAKSFCYYLEEKINPQAPDAALQCYHGIGHGAIEMIIQQEARVDNEEALVSSALSLCESAADNEDQLFRCASGVFNAVANFYIQEDFSFKLNPKDPIWLCHAQPQEYKESCYGNMNSLLWWLVENQDLGKAAKYLETVKDEKLAESSIRYLAGNSALYITSDPQTAIESCRALKPSFREPCVEGLAHGLLEHGTPAYEYNDALKFCRSSALNVGEAEVCFRYVLSNLPGWYSDEKAEEICRQVEEPYKKHCQS